MVIIYLNEMEIKYQKNGIGDDESLAIYKPN